MRCFLCPVSDARLESVADLSDGPSAMNECGCAADERDVWVCTGVDVEGPAAVEPADATRLDGLCGRGFRDDWPLQSY